MAKELTHEQVEATVFRLIARYGRDADVPMALARLVEEHGRLLVIAYLSRLVTMLELSDDNDDLLA